MSRYVLSALSLEGSRSSERQMIASSWLLMIASVAFSYATPVDQMHPQRPLRSLFHPAIFISMAGQALIHLWTMHQAVSMARDEMGPDKLAEVVEFHRKERPRAHPNPNPNHNPNPDPDLNPNPNPNPNRNPNHQAAFSPSSAEPAEAATDADNG